MSIDLSKIKTAVSLIPDVLPEDRFVLFADMFLVCMSFGYEKKYKIKPGERRFLIEIAKRQIETGQHIQTLSEWREFVAGMVSDGILRSENLAGTYKSRLKKRNWLYAPSKGQLAVSKAILDILKKGEFTFFLKLEVDVTETQDSGSDLE